MPWNWHRLAPWLLLGLLAGALYAAHRWAQAAPYAAAQQRAARAWREARFAAAGAWLAAQDADAAADPAATYRYALALARSGQWDRALAAWEALFGPALDRAGLAFTLPGYAATPDPTAAALWARYARAADQAHAWPRATAAWRAAVQTAPQPPAAYRYEYALHLAAAAFPAPEARALLTELAQDASPRARAAQRVAQALAEATLADDPAYARTFVGRALAAAGRWDLATWSWALAVRHNPAYPPAWAYFGEGALRLGWPQRAAGALWVARRLAPHDPLPLLLLSRWAQGQNRPFTALAWARRAWALEPDNPALAANLAAALTQALPGQVEPALALLRYPVRVHPQDPRARLTLARLALQWGLAEPVALPALRAVLAQHPQHPTALALMGYAYLQQGDMTLARRFLDRALAQDPTLAEAHLYLGWLAAQAGRTGEARDHLRQALQWAPPGDPVAVLARRSLQRLEPASATPQAPPEP